MSWGSNSKDDGWGANDGGWGSTNDDGEKKSGGWDSKPNDEGEKKTDSWGSANTSDNGKSAGWGQRDNNFRGRGRGRGGPRGGGWNSNDTRPKNDSWGSASNNDREKGWKSGDSGTKGNSGWGSSDAGAKNNSGWGSSDTGAKSDGWGSSTNNDQERGSSGWGSSNAGARKESWGSANNNDRDAGSDDNNRKRFKRESDEQNPDQEQRPAPYKPDEVDLDEEVMLQGDGAGENFNRYQDQEVTCLPIDCIKPIEKFTDFLTSELLLKNIEAQKYGGMTPIQKWSIPAILNNHDLIGCAQTGSGKTAAFLLPILQKILDLKPDSCKDEDCQNPYCLIISPTRELANQINVHANMLSKDSMIKCHVIYGQVSTGHLKSKLATGCHVLVATPGRLKDFVNRGWIGFKNIKYIILDEGDRLVDEGFTSDIAGFFEHESMPSKEDRQTLFFSATFKEETQLNARKYLKDDFLFLTVGRVGAANEDIKQEFIQVSRQEKKRELKKILAGVPDSDKTIVFTQTKNAADMLAGFFTALNLSSTSIHGDRLQSQREQAIKAFRKGEKRFLISSPVGNRGLDLPKVSLVINYDLPANIDEYVHRIGRTGRAGHTGRAISFYDQERDTELLPHLVEILTEAKQDIPDWMKGNVDQGTSQFNTESNNDSSNPPAEAATVATDTDWGDAAWN